MYRYLLNVVFYAGSNAPEDTDRDLYILTSDEEISEEEMFSIFETVNGLLIDDENDFPFSYDEHGVNITTLMDGVQEYTKSKVEEVYTQFGTIENIENFYYIEQWQQEKT